MQNTAQKTETGFFIGQAVYHTRNSRFGYITEIKENKHQTFLMIGGSSPMSPIKYSISIVWDNNTISRDLDENTVLGWVEYAERMDAAHKTEAEALEMEAEAMAEAERLQNERRARDNEHAAKVQAWRDDHASKVPAWAKAVIVAERIKDESNMMEDYHGGRTEEVIILGFSKHERDLFSEMRKFCAHVPEVQHLAVKPDKPADADKWWTAPDEHREKYSMGGGYYLKDGYRYSDGWRVSKRTFYNADPNKLIDSIPYGRWAVVDLASKRPAPSSKPAESLAGNHAAHIEQHTHTKKGFDMFIVILANRVERDEFNALRDQAKEIGGWYSRKWGTTPCGFAFKEQETAEQFLKLIEGDTPPDDSPTPGKGDKLRDMADKLESQIQGKFADRQENTAKRQAQAAHARLEGERLKRTQSALYALADMHDAGTVPGILAGISSKKAVYDLMCEKLASVQNGFHGYSIGTGEIHNTIKDNPQAVALWELLTPKSEAEKQAESLAQKVRELQGCKIPGYFPTPIPVIDLMLNGVYVFNGMEITEPEIGSAAIADRFCEIYGDQHRENIQGVEINHTLAEISKAKGYNVLNGDFLEVCLPPNTEDLILMNPPFENLQDCDHVQKAYTLLKSGGQLRAIMSPSFEYNSKKKAQAFRQWLENLTYEVTDIPAGEFRESGTMIASKLLIIDKE